MGEVVNLRKARKLAKKQDASARAASNRVIYGRSKAERSLQAHRSDKVLRKLDAHRIGTGDAE